MQVTLSSISDGIKNTSEENESLRAECVRLKEQVPRQPLNAVQCSSPAHATHVLSHTMQLVDTLNRLQKSAEYNEKIVEVRAAESKLYVLQNLPAQQHRALSSRSSFSCRHQAPIFNHVVI
jgi:hypothetical protein